jgi:plastocyanin|tara:strand:- start:102 stop:1970 length:1869 start_codon:yes stop_codon:yes gene_type:complete
MTNYKTISSLIFLASLSACGGGGGDAVDTAAIVSDAYSVAGPAAPVISSASSYSVQENQTAIATAIATDSDSSSLTFSLTGTDASALSINSSTGVMTFNTAPDYETKSSYAVTLNVSDGALSATKNLTISITDSLADNPLACKTASYTTLPPAASSSDSVMNYYSYSWQAIDFELLPICLNYYEATATITSPWKTYIEGIYDYSKFTLGHIVPINAFILAAPRASASAAETTQFNTDFCTIVNASQVSQCVAGSDPMANRSAAGGVGFEQLPNGGDQQLFQDGLWGSGETVFRAIAVIAHEYYHVHQNGLKFYIEATDKFAIPKAWPGNSSSYDSASIPKYMPNWIEEGGAEFGGIIIAAKYIADNSIDITGGSSAEQEFQNHIRAAFDGFAANASLSLEDFNMGDNGGQNPGLQYSAGAAALMYLWLQDDANYQKIMIDYYANWAEAEALRAGYGWADAFKNTFQKDGNPYEITTFYTDFNTWIRSDTKANLKASIKTKNQMLHANLLPTTENTPIAITLVAAPKVIDNGGANKYFIDGVQQKSLSLQPGKTYTFTHPSTHPIVFSTTSDGTHSSGTNYTEGVTKVSSTETTLKVTATTSATLYYYCSVHSGMGGKIKSIQ